jgi:2-polyprenyl-3-methyl-5-hydroxy-6-metoxy-1,4-benzoquinol methylase
MKHVTAPLVGFETAPSIEAMLAQMNPNYTKRTTKRFPVRYLRYWFVRNILIDLHARLNRPLRVLEVGVGYGKMLAFMAGKKVASDRYALPDSIERWDALSAQADPRTLSRYSYSSFRQADIEKPLLITDGRYDAVIVLHVLEHLSAPESAMRRLLPAIGDGGLLVGGSPTMPALIAKGHERQLRRKYAGRMDDLRTHKHLSVITPGRIRRFARTEGLSVELLSGAFLVRSSRSPLEDYPWWLRVNLAWGALFPALGGELYFALRKARSVLSLLVAIVTDELFLEVSS